MVFNPLLGRFANILLAQWCDAFLSIETTRVLSLAIWLIVRNLGSVWEWVSELYQSEEKIVSLNF